jgi:hypothetical protein
LFLRPGDLQVQKVRHKAMSFNFLPLHSTYKFVFFGRYERKFCRSKANVYECGGRKVHFHWDFPKRMKTLFFFDEKLGHFLRISLELPVRKVLLWHATEPKKAGEKCFFEH